MSVVVPLATLLHAGAPLAPHDLWRAWNLSPGVLLPLGLGAWVYARGIRRARPLPEGARAARGQAGARRQTAAAVAGWLALVVALVSPLDALGGVLFSAHMAQHQVLLAVAAPLVILGRPIAAMLRGLPARWRGRAATIVRSGPVRLLLEPGMLGAWVFHAIVIWIWHIPALYARAVENEIVHVIQHTCFLAAAFVYWQSVLRGWQRRAPMGAGLGVLSLFLTSLHAGALGALITFAPTAFFTPYLETAPLWGLTPLEDQQLAGLLMWIPGGVAYLVATVALATLLVRERNVHAQLLPTSAVSQEVR